MSLIVSARASIMHDNICSAPFQRAPCHTTVASVGDISTDLIIQPKPREWLKEICENVQNV